MSNCSTSSPSLSATQGQDKNHGNEPQSFSTFTKVRNSQTQTNAAESISTPNKAVQQDHNDSENSSFNFISKFKKDPLSLFISLKTNMKTIIEEWEGMSEEDKKPFIEMGENERKKRLLKYSVDDNSQQSDTQSSDPPKESFNSFLSFVNSKRKDIKNIWEEMSEEAKKPYIEIVEIETNEPPKPKLTFYSGPFLLFFKSKEKMIQDEWEKMSDEEKKPFVEKVEKKEEEEKKKFQENESKFKFRFKPLKKTPFDLFHESRKEFFKAEWDKMTEEEKKPYNDMEKNNRKLYSNMEFQDPNPPNNNLNENKTDPKKTLKDVFAHWIQLEDESKATFIKGGPKSFRVFMKSKEKTIKKEWDQMTEEEKKPYDELAAEEEENKAEEREQENKAEEKEQENKAEEREQENKAEEKEQENKEEEKEEEKSQEDSSKSKFRPPKKTSFDFFRDSRQTILKTEWDKMTEEEKKPYDEMVVEVNKDEVSKKSLLKSVQESTTQRIKESILRRNLPHSRFNMNKTGNESNESKAKLSTFKMTSSNQEQPKFSFGFGQGRPRSYHIFMNTKDKTIKEEWNQMNEEEKKPYEEMAEKEEKRKAEEEAKKKSQEDSSKFKFKFTPPKKTSFDFYRDSRKETLTAEWDKMTEEEKKPYNEMVKEEQEEARRKEEERKKAATIFIKHPPSKQTFKLLLIGDGSVGKTTLVNLQSKGVFSKDYKATLGVSVSRITFNTSSNNPITFECWDTAGQERFGGLREGYYFDSDCMILMFDVTNPSSYRNVSTWYRDFNRRENAVNVPWVLVGNKIDEKMGAVPSKRVDFHKKNYTEYFQISCKTRYHVNSPFLYLARILRNDPSLEFV